jgi:hypothetical protein
MDGKETNRIKLLKQDIQAEVDKAVDKFAEAYNIKNKAVLNQAILLGAEIGALIVKRHCNL